MKKIEANNEAIYKELRRSIIMGHLKPGERLNIEALAGKYQTSITPVRDAIQRLSHEELVTVRPRFGYFVTHITLKKLTDMLDLRLILEVAAVERAAERITLAEIHAMRHVHAGYTGDDDVSYDRYTDENRRFHYLLAEASGNHELANLLGHVHDTLARFMVIRHAGETQPVNHTRIVDALANQDVACARQAIIEEVEASRKAILAKVLEDESGSWEIGL